MPLQSTQSGGWGDPHPSHAAGWVAVPEPTLRQITDAAPSPWGDILREHHVALLGLTSQVAELAEILRDELMTSSRGIADFLNTIAPPTNGDGPLNDVDLRSDV